MDPTFRLSVRHIHPPVRRISEHDPILLVNEGTVSQYEYKLMYTVPQRFWNNCAGSRKPRWPLILTPVPESQNHNDLDPWWPLVCECLKQCTCVIISHAVSYRYWWTPDVFRLRVADSLEHHRSQWSKPANGLTSTGLYRPVLPLATGVRYGGNRYRQCSNIEAKLCSCRYVLDVRAARICKSHR